MKNIVKSLRPLIDILLAPLVLISAIILLGARKCQLSNLKVCKKILLRVGVMPIKNHYYEPLFDKKHLRFPLSQDRYLPGIDWNIEEQLSVLNHFNYSEEFVSFPDHYVSDHQYHFDNTSFLSGDAEYWYNLIRFKKPKRIIEVGSGHSTKMACLAVAKNKSEDSSYQCEHICIEPYEMPWLEKLGIQVLREKVECVDLSLFNKLGEGDILFIDSSHVIRPQGDVLFEYLELLPILNAGVIVHVHDIYSPKDYPETWLIDEVKFWNEQYLLEAFLTSNKDWKILGALNFLQHHHYEQLRAKCPRLTPDREPGSFYLVKTS